jgi:ABC-type multidrug transport system fused ATPase/permease subunit
LWGPIGSGKSTLMQILHRKYPLLKGEILLGNRSIQEIDLSAYRGKVAVVPERIKVINGTLIENILLGRQVSDLKDLNTLLGKYCFNDYLQKFERGLFTILGENGHHLSGGELQMLGLIRALINEPEILIIDEGLNALDTETELTIFKEIELYARNHFVMLCTHNIALISRVDYLYVLHSGQIIQQGTPARLIRENGYFKRIWKMWKSKINDFELVAV